jgi:hypothetical protein
MDCSQGYIFQTTSMQIYFNFQTYNFFYRGDLAETDKQTVFFNTYIKVLSVCIQNCQTKSCSHGYLKNTGAEYTSEAEAQVSKHYPTCI